MTIPTKMEEATVGYKYPALFDEKHMLTDWICDLAEDGRTIHTQVGSQHKEAFYREDTLWQIVYNSQSNWLLLFALDGKNGEEELLDIILHPADGNCIAVTHKLADNGHLFKFWLK